MTTAFNTQLDSSWEEADQLISILRTWGIGYLVGENHPLSPSDIARNRQAAVTLVKRLAQCEYPRVRDASISLFLLHPELAPAVLEAFQTSEVAVAEQIATLTLATLYLQRLWSIRLILALGHPSCFPEEPFAFLWCSRHLPPPVYHNGKWGLAALEKTEQRRTGLPLNFIGDWQNQIDHLLLQEEPANRTPAIPVKQFLEAEKEGERNVHSRGWARPRLANPDEYEQECEIDMSMRPNVDKGQIENFLKNLGRTFRKPGRLYLVGGAALVHMGLRSGTTQDIDIQVYGTNTGEMFDAIRQLVRQMNINVEAAPPGNFIPLPSQWMAQSKFIGRYGTIDVFYFDFYSIALTKIQRGNTRDINDIRLLVQHKVITLQGLDGVYQEVLPKVGKEPYEWLDPERFAARYQTVRQLL